jgi:hypothetical protein
MQVEYKTDEKLNRYPFVDIGSGYHGRPAYRLWISPSFITKEGEWEILEFPIRGAEIQKTEKGNYVLRKKEDSVVYNLYVRCGFRGSASFEILSDERETFPYTHYHSGCGALGVSEGALVNHPYTSLKYRWSKSGRLYGNAGIGIRIISPDGEIYDFEGVKDGLESFDELPVIANEAPASEKEKEVK